MKSHHELQNCLSWNPEVPDLLISALNPKARTFSLSFSGRLCRVEPLALRLLVDEVRTILLRVAKSLRSLEAGRSR